MLITTMSLFIIMTIYLIPLSTEQEKMLPTNLELEYITSLGNHSIYLLNENNYLVKTKILLDGKTLEENIKTMLRNLTIAKDSKFPNALKAIIPEKTKVNQVTVTDSIAVLDFSKEFLQIEKDKEEKMIEAIVYSLTGLKGVDGVTIKVEGETLTKLPQSNKMLDPVLTRKIGINKRYDLTSTKDINKVVIYYTETIDDSSFYVPVTKYLNDARDKISIIIEELTTSYIYEPNLSSLINENTVLLNQEQEDDLMILNFNDALFDANGILKEEVLYTISYSVFDNYDVNTMALYVNGKEASIVKKADLP